jgi:hypothetical protein
VGVARQYSGTLGKTDNCQIAVSLHYAAPKATTRWRCACTCRSRGTSQPERMAAARVPTHHQAPSNKE